MICLLALPVLAILSIFSATHRKLATEAFDCVFRRLTLRKCEAALDLKLKSAITATVMKRSPTAAGFIFKRFEIISWIFLIIMILSTFYSVYGGYNYLRYGNCNGENSSEFCVYKALEPQTPTCKVEECTSGQCSCNETCKGDQCIDACDTKGA